MTKKDLLLVVLIAGLAIGVTGPAISHATSASTQQASYQVYPNVTYTFNNYNVTIGDNVRISNPNSFIGPNSMRFDMYSVGYIYRVSSTEPAHIYIQNISNDYVTTQIVYPSYYSQSKLSNTSTTIGLANYHSFTLPSDVTYFNESKKMVGGDQKQDFAYKTDTQQKITVTGNNFQSGQTVSAYDSNGTVLAKTTVSPTGILNLTLPPSQFSTTHIYLTGATSAAPSGGGGGGFLSGISNFIGGFISYIVNHIYLTLISITIIAGVLFYAYGGGGGGGGGHKTSTVKTYSKG